MVRLVGVLALHWPSVHGRVAWQEAVGAIACCSLQYRPIGALADFVSAGDHDPMLASMIGAQLHLDLHVRAWGDLGHSNAASVVPLLPCAQALGMHVGLGTARCSWGVEVSTRIVPIGTREWLVPEIFWETLWPISPVVFQQPLELVFAQGLHHPTMTCRLRDEQRCRQGFHHDCEGKEITLLSK